eukprot:TRINITY_DN50683_c0_g1_i1.p4 TRINITY_DN50683_c0_g1~~TRINITY_DN50683_c0_g1_i1.p4  ORF type:complete len:123 (+),score=44.08 TRINITY_DN50683_c0_g1_i1:353-721(+)
MHGFGTDLQKYTGSTDYQELKRFAESIKATCHWRVPSACSKDERTALWRKVVDYKALGADGRKKKIEEMKAEIKRIPGAMKSVSNFEALSREKGLDLLLAVDDEDLEPLRPLVSSLGDGDEL